MIEQSWRRAVEQCGALEWKIGCGADECSASNALKCESNALLAGSFVEVSQIEALKIVIFFVEIMDMYPRRRGEVIHLSVLINVDTATPEELIGQLAWTNDAQIRRLPLCHPRSGVAVALFTRESCGRANRTQRELEALSLVILVTRSE